MNRENSGCYRFLSFFSSFPTTLDDITGLWGEDIETSKETSSLLTKTQTGYRAHLPEYFLIEEPIGVGGGYGDPLDRAPEGVLQDIINHILGRIVLSEEQKNKCDQNKDGFINICDVLFFVKE